MLFAGRKFYQAGLLERKITKHIFFNKLIKLHNSTANNLNYLERLKIQNVNYSDPEWSAGREVFYYKFGSKQNYDELFSYKILSVYLLIWRKN